MKFGVLSRARVAHVMSCSDFNERFTLWIERSLLSKNYVPIKKSPRFLQVFWVLHARGECATHADVHLMFAQMMCSISAVFEGDLRVFLRIFGAEFRRIRSEIARFCIGLGGILARTTRASPVKRAQSSLAVVAHCLEIFCIKILNVRCGAREKFVKNLVKISH